MMPIKRSGIGLALVAVLGILAGAMDDTAAAAPSASTEQLRYRVQHSKFGNIGTYTNVVQTAGDVTTVRTSVHLLVTVLGVGLHREDAERTERWQNGRLMSFTGTTTKNGDKVEVKGAASGNDFVITSPLGTFTAPATVQPANPWSAKCVNSTTMMRVDNGKIEQVRVSGGSETTVAINGANSPARQYQIDGATRYKIWIDQHDIPVMFVVDDDSGEVTFTLEK
jgi:Family of unknown function (DUF6134)